MPASTIRWWVTGRSYHIETGHQTSKPIIELPAKDSHLLSVEIHVLDAIRREHRIPLDKVRTALQYLKKYFPSKHPLAEGQFETNGVDLFVKKYGQLRISMKSARVSEEFGQRTGLFGQIRTKRR